MLHTNQKDLGRTQPNWVMYCCLSYFCIRKSRFWLFYVLSLMSFYFLVGTHIHLLGLFISHKSCFICWIFLLFILEKIYILHGSNSYTNYYYKWISIHVLLLESLIITMQPRANKSASYFHVAKTKNSLILSETKQNQEEETDFFKSHFYIVQWLFIHLLFI